MGAWTTRQSPRQAPLTFPARCGRPSLGQAAAPEWDGQDVFFRDSQGALRWATPSTPTSKERQRRPPRLRLRLSIRSPALRLLYVRSRQSWSRKRTWPKICRHSSPGKSKPRRLLQPCARGAWRYAGNSRMLRAMRCCLVASAWLEAWTSSPGQMWTWKELLLASTGRWRCGPPPLLLLRTTRMFVPTGHFRLWDHRLQSVQRAVRVGGMPCLALASRPQS
mmetsp:Transcript_16812/g.36150  ORF Transcript_16812/g.36150 Transcript_16812/m.36150 type:complete len:221 (+) Transcript_16812:423-1085(+)